MNNQLSSVVTKEDLSNMPTMDNEPFPAMHDFSIDTCNKGITTLLQDQNPLKAKGPDCIPTKFLVAKEITPALALIYQAPYPKVNVPRQITGN